MAASKSFAAAVVMIAMMMLSAINFVSAQEVAAPAPAPSMDKGAAALSFVNNGALICSSLLLSLLAVFRH